MIFLNFNKKKTDMTFDIDMIKKVYERYPERIAAARQITGKPLTIKEKIYSKNFIQQ